MESRQEWRITGLRRIDEAESFVEEQAALDGHPGVTLQGDLPQDRGKLWRLHTHDMTEVDAEAYSTVCSQHGLPWEKGTGVYYLDMERLGGVVRALQAEGFVVALAPDAAFAMP